MEMTICAANSAVIVTVFLGRVFSPGSNEAMFILSRPDDALGLRHVLIRIDDSGAVCYNSLAPINLASITCARDL